jgi:hypothetical protein
MAVRGRILPFVDACLSIKPSPARTLTPDSCQALEEACTRQPAPDTDAIPGH